MYKLDRRHRHWLKENGVIRQGVLWRKEELLGWFDRCMVKGSFWFLFLAAMRRMHGFAGGCSGAPYKEWQPMHLLAYAWPRSLEQTPLFVSDLVLSCPWRDWDHGEGRGEGRTERIFLFDKYHVVRNVAVFAVSKWKKQRDLILEWSRDTQHTVVSLEDAWVRAERNKKRGACSVFYQRELLCFLFSNRSAIS